MAQAFITRRKGGGGVNKDLPEQITAFTATADSTPQITLSWVNPVEYWAGTLIVKKAGSAPSGVNDGEKIYKGEGTSYTDFDVSFDTEYFYRAFPFNAKKQYQTEVLTVNATPKNVLEPSELPVGASIQVPYGDTLVNFKIVHKGLPSNIYDESCNGVWAWGNEILYTTTTTFANTSSMFSYATSDVANVCKTILQNFSTGISKYFKQVKIPYTYVWNHSSSGWETGVYSGEKGFSTQLFPLAAVEFGAVSANLRIDGAKLDYFDASDAASEKRIAHLNDADVTHWTRSLTDYWGTPKGVANAGKIIDSVTGGKHYVSVAFILTDDARFNPTPNADGSYSLIE